MATCSSYASNLLTYTTYIISAVFRIQCIKILNPVARRRAATDSHRGASTLARLPSKDQTERCDN